MTPNKIRIATRSSRLALWQAEHVRERIQTQFPGISIHLLKIKTRGDKILHTPLAKVGGKGLFIKELEHAILDGDADIAVHSMKDVPVDMPPGLHIPVILNREDPRDALLAGAHKNLADLPKGCVIGTSSLRRKSQILSLRSDLNFRDLRGNVPTRIEQLQAGEYDAIILASAGLVRLGLTEAISARFSTEQLVPAIGQGAIGIECREQDEAIRSIIDHLNDVVTHTCVSAERAMNACLNGGCEAPIAGHAVLKGEVLTLSGLVASLDGREVLRETLSGAADEAEQLGQRLGERLLARGGGEILQAIRALD